MFVLQRQSRDAVDYERLWLGLFVLIAICGVAWFHFNLPTPRCPIHDLTGQPCLTCGGTRSLHALYKGHLKDSFLWNPLVFLGVVAGVAYALYAIVAISLKTARIRFSEFSERELLMLRTVVVLALAGNWIYLLFRFSRPG